VIIVSLNLLNLLQDKQESSVSPLQEFRKRLGLPSVAARPMVIDSSTSDKELIALGRRLLNSEDRSDVTDPAEIVKVLSMNWAVKS
jgi:hypothetical protein